MNKFFGFAIIVFLYASAFCAGVAVFHKLVELSIGKSVLCMLGWYGILFFLCAMCEFAEFLIA